VVSVNGKVSAELESTSALAFGLARADTQFRAWAGIVMSRAKEPRHRALGKEIIESLTGNMSVALEHSDLAAYALIATETLSDKQKSLLTSSFPPPSSDRALRSRFYDSATLVYLAARGLGDNFPDKEGVGRIVRADLTELLSHSNPSIQSVLLRLATLIEMEGTERRSEELYRQTTGRVVALAGDGAAAIAGRWFLERYGRGVPAPETRELRDAVAKLVERSASGLMPSVATDPTLAAMELETRLLQSPSYELLPVGSASLDAARRAGKLRFATAIAFAIVIALSVLAPNLIAVYNGRLARLPAFISALFLGTVLIVWGVLTALGRPRSLEGLGGGSAIGIVYYGAILSAGITEFDKMTEVLISPEVVIAIGLAIILAVFVALQAAVVPELPTRERESILPPR
jgi:hypothetical protein